MTAELLFAASAISRATTPSCHSPPPTAAPPHRGHIDQVSAVEEGPADQELLEEAIKLEPIHLPVFKSSRLLAAAGCILSHPVLAALSPDCKPNHPQESSSSSGCSTGPNPSRCLAPGLSAAEIRGFPPTAFFQLRRQLLTVLRLGCQMEFHSNVMSCQDV